MKPDLVGTYVRMVSSVCLTHGFPPLVTLSSVNAHCFDSVVPLRFDRSDPGAAERALACYRELWEEGRRIGVVPYRAGIETLGLWRDPASVFWNLAATLKRAVDPEELIAPGRYLPTEPLETPTPRP
jgi:4-cresol dehydrogenase (hydroxylating)